MTLARKDTTHTSQKYPFIVLRALLERAEKKIQEMDIPKIELLTMKHTLLIERVQLLEDKGAVEMEEHENHDVTKCHVLEFLPYGYVFVTANGYHMSNPL